MLLTLSVLDVDGNIICEKQGTDEIYLNCRRKYEAGDRILVDCSKKDVYLMVQVDDALGSAFVYVKDTIIYTIPFGEKRFCYSPKVFIGDNHLLAVRMATETEIHTYKNLALNIMDQQGDVSCYPHASANVETRGESVFAAKNAINGVVANDSHGGWPFESWGINRQADAAMKVDFGRLVEVDKIRMYTRADFPHDSWWKKVTIQFSDDSIIEWELEKSDKAHVITFEPKTISSLVLKDLIQADDPSPFPALTQIEVYGNESRVSLV